MYRSDGEMRCLRMFHVHGTLSESLAIYKSPYLNHSVQTLKLAAGG